MLREDLQNPPECIVNLGLLLVKYSRQYVNEGPTYNPARDAELAEALQ